MGVSIHDFHTALFIPTWFLRVYRKLGFAFPIKYVCYVLIVNVPHSKLCLVIICKRNILRCRLCLFKGTNNDRWSWLKLAPSRNRFVKKVTLLFGYIKLLLWKCCINKTALMISKIFTSIFSLILNYSLIIRAHYFAVFVVLSFIITK